MSDIATLAWLQWRQTVNFLKQSLRKPARIAVALFGAAYIAFLFWMRTLPSRPVAVKTGVPEPFATALGLALAALVGVMFLSTGMGYVRGFASPADARFLIGSKLPETLVVSWVQMRSAFGTVMRAIWALLIYAVVFRTAGTSLGIILTSAGFFALAGALPIPMLKAERRCGVPLARIFAGAFFLAAGIPLIVIVLAWFAPLFAPWSQAVVHTGIGGVVNALLNGSYAWLGVLYAAVALSFAAGYLFGQDVYPELYAGSTRLLRLRERQTRAGMTLTAEREKRAKHEFRAPALLDRAGGAWALLWRDVTAFGRSQPQRLGFIGGMIGAIVAGAGIGIAARRAADGIELSVAIGSSIVNVEVILVTMATTVALGDDLRKPLFWLCADPLRSRLYAWIVSTSWRPAATFAAGLAAWALAMGDAQIAWIGLPVAVALIALLRSIGLALYSIFPGRADQRGPLALARMLVTYVLIVPPAGAGIALGAVAHDAVLATGLGCAVGLAEVLLLTELASRRIEGRGASLAQAEGE